jgi:hypothetical protein
MDKTTVCLMIDSQTAQQVTDIDGKPAKKKRSGLLGQFISYKRNEVLLVASASGHCPLF